MTSRTAPKESVAMEKCVYCGNQLPEKPLTVKVKETDFEVCSQTCQQASEKYLARDKKLKMVLYLVVFAAAIVIILTAIAEGSMVGANIAQIAVGLAFIVLPYPISNFTTFKSCPVRTTVLITRIVGAVLLVSGVVFLLGALL